VFDGDEYNEQRYGEKHYANQVIIVYLLLYRCLFQWVDGCKQTPYGSSNHQQ
jgi:hypothetical protein